MKYYKIEFTKIPRVLLVNSFTGRIPSTDVFSFSGKKPEIELTLIGRGIMYNKYLSGASEKILPGQMNVRMPWEQFSRTYYAGEHSSHTMIFTDYQNITQIDADDVKQIYRSGLPPKSTVPTVFCLPEVVLQTPPKAESIFRKMKTLFTFGNGGKDLRMFSCLFQLLAELTDSTILQAFQDSNTAGIYSNALYSRKATEYISQHISDKITVSDVANYIGISNEYLCRIFRNETGHTIISYVNLVKMEAVKEMIITQHLSLREAGAQVGIENEVYLNRLFKKYFGVTSSEYRQLHRK